MYNWVKGLILGGLVSVFYLIFLIGMRGADNISLAYLCVPLLSITVLAGFLGAIGNFNFPKFLLIGIVPFINNVIAEVQHFYTFVPIPLEQPLLIRAIVSGLYGFVELVFFLVVSYVMLEILEYGSLIRKKGGK